MNQTHRHCAIYQKLNWRLMTRVNRYNFIASWKKPGAYAIQQLPPQSSCCHVTPRISATKPGNGKVETAVNHPPIEHVTFFSEGWFEELHAKLPPGFFWTFVVSFFSDFVGHVHCLVWNVDLAMYKKIRFAQASMYWCLLGGTGSGVYAPECVVCVVNLQISLVLIPFIVQFVSWQNVIT